MPMASHATLLGVGACWPKHHLLDLHNTRDEGGRQAYIGAKMYSPVCSVG